MMTLLLLVIVVLVLLTLLLFLTKHTSRRRPALRTVAILVLGDIGRSPRMMYHTQSFANAGFETTLIGYQGSKPLQSLRSSPSIRIHYIPQFPQFLNVFPFILIAPFKVAHQAINILVAFWSRFPQPPEFILVQNPPSIPALPIVQAIGWACGSKVIIDWHNLGYSILALKLGTAHPLVRFAERLESFFGRKAYAHLFVTNAMREHLGRRWHLQGHLSVLHDRPPLHFHPATPSETHALFLRLSPSFPPSVTSFLPSSDPPHQTPFTELITSPAIPLSTFPNDAGEPNLRKERPALVVSSTSWGADEDFGMFLKALEGYELRARRQHENKRAQERLPKMLVVVTGRGPLRANYMAQVEERQKGWEWVRCVSMWLAAEDYPVLLGSADIGVSLHSSSSGLDLPMKIVDMFGCGLPVCALDFACLDELVTEGVNGVVFSSAGQLADHLSTLLTDFPHSPSLAKLRASLSRSSDPSISSNRDGGEEREKDVMGTWEANWAHVVKPLILRDEGGYHEEWLDPHRRSPT